MLYYKYIKNFQNQIISLVFIEETKIKLLFSNKFMCTTEIKCNYLCILTHN